MVHATGCVGGVTTQFSASDALIVSTGSREPAEQPEASIQITARTVDEIIPNLRKVSAPGHADPDSADQDQADHSRRGTHILGPAG